MTLSDSILLQISQRKTSYNDLLTRILPNYKSINSAKAALSRTIKNLIAFDHIFLSDDFYVLTAKGKAIVESKIKNKLLINIHDKIISFKKTNTIDVIDDVVKDIQIFLERSKQDKTLLRIGKTSASFYISDLEIIDNYLNKLLKHYNYMRSKLQKHILSLQEINFEDQITLTFDEKIFKHVNKYAKFYNISDIVIDCDKDNSDALSFFENKSEFIKKSETTFLLNLKNINVFKVFLKSTVDPNLTYKYSNIKFKIYINEIIANVNLSNMVITFSGPHNLIYDIKSVMKNVR